MGQDILHFIKDNACRLVDSEEPHHGGNYCHQNHNLVIGRWEIEYIIICDAI